MRNQIHNEDKSFIMGVLSEEDSKHLKRWRDLQRREDEELHEIVLAIREVAGANRSLAREIREQVRAIDALVDSNAALVDQAVATDDDASEDIGGFLSDTL